MHQAQAGDYSFRPLTALCATRNPSTVYSSNSSIPPREPFASVAGSSAWLYAVYHSR
ncbi:MAG: hypothetical protein JW874_08245 [Spirochaetales bacterium]|nr:hypothetical protein [Spirochaetales bacterium]